MTTCHVNLNKPGINTPSILLLALAAIMLVGKPLSAVELPPELPLGEMNRRSIRFAWKWKSKFDPSQLRQDPYPDKIASSAASRHPPIVFIVPRSRMALVW